MDLGEQHPTSAHDGSAASDFADLARELQVPATERGTIHAVLDLAQALLGADHAGFTTEHHGRFKTVASTSDVAVQVDELQYSLREGPCVGVIQAGTTLRSLDVEVDDRWPRFGPRAAAEAGIHGMLSHRLFVEGDTIGALNLYSLRVGAFGEGEERTGTVFAAHAALALRAARVEERARNLNLALESNRRIGTAIGILMVRRQVTEQAAFEMLRRYSQDHNLPVVKVVEQVLYTGELDADH